jgi:alkyldihydroxyacetonephosphate synthase
MSERTLVDLAGRVGTTLVKEARGALHTLRGDAPTGVATGDTRFVPSVAAPIPAADREADDGWGFADTRFVVRPDGTTVLTGNRYSLCSAPTIATSPTIRRPCRPLARRARCRPTSRSSSAPSR